MNERNLADDREATLLRGRVFKKMEQDIVGGRYEPGTILSEKELLAELNVSRTPLREALAQLELEGLVEAVPHHGIRVLGVSRSDIDDIYAIKLTMDGLAARLAAARATPEELKALDETLDLMDFYAQRDDLERVVALDAEFHDLICKAGKNRPLRAMLANYHNFVRIARQKSMGSPGRLDRMMTEHRAILDAIARGDAVAAEKLAAGHISNAQHSIEKALAEKSE